MRITSEVLLNLANDAISHRTRSQRDILAVYLHGSLLKDDPVIAGTTDIDLFIIHVDRVATRREIERITDDIHLDIAHDSREDYRQARNLRMDPWKGPVMNSCKILYDPQHFLDFIQAGVRAQFDRPDNVLGRARQQIRQARQAWLGFQINPPAPGPEGLKEYLNVVQEAANAVALLSGPPLTERRFLLQLEQCAIKAAHPGLYAGLLGLLGSAHASQILLQELLSEWKAAYQQASPEGQPAPARLHAHRFHYYSKALENLLASAKSYQASLWPLLRTWVDMAPRSAQTASAWATAMNKLGLVGDGLTERIQALDAYLDTVDEALDEWGHEHGA